MRAEAIRDSLQKVMLAQPEAGAIVQIRPTGFEPVTFTLGKHLLPGTQGEDAGFPVYSIAKTFLALFTLNLAEAGKLSLRAPISTYLKREIPAWLKDADLRHLLSHRSGLFDYGPLKSYHEAVRKSPGQAMGFEGFIAEVLEKGPQFQTGTSFCYSNVGYLFVREILETVTGRDLQAIFDETIGAKLGLRMEFLSGSSDKIIPGFSPYLGEGSPDVRSLYDFSWVAHGTYLATVSELTTLFASFDRIISQDSIREMTSLQPVDFLHPLIRPSYGLGFMGDMDSPFGPIYGHNGGGPGFSTAAYWAPNKKASVAAVVNRDSGLEAETLVFTALRLV